MQKLTKRTTALILALLLALMPILTGTSLSTDSTDAESQIVASPVEEFDEAAADESDKELAKLVKLTVAELQQSEEGAFGILEEPEPELNPVPLGDGTQGAPYLIASVANLQWVRAQINGTATNAEFRAKYYKLTADLDMSEEEWSPLGAANATAFFGNFDGNGKVISNLSVRLQTGNVGFFGVLNGATITNLALVNVDIYSTANIVGGIAGNTTGTASTIAGCYVSGSVEAVGATAGGILGTTAIAVTIENCLVDGSVKATTSAGGILGQYTNGYPVIGSCIVLASVEATTNGGGILGNKNAAGTITIENCRVLSGSVTATTATAGAIYGNAVGTGSLNISDVSAWKGLVLAGVPLKEILYGEPLFNNDKNGGIVLSWTLATASGWPQSLRQGVWSYAAGSLPVLAYLTDTLSDDFPAYMSDYLTAPGDADKTALQAAINSAETLQALQYPDEWNSFQTVLARVKIVSADSESSQAELDAATTELEAAVGLLKSRNALELEGDGTAEAPFLIGNAELLQKMNRLINSSDATVRDAYRGKHYKLTADIDMSGIEWLPLGRTEAAAFTGVFDGDGQSISNLSVSVGTGAAMFSYISDATIRNLTLENCRTEATQYGYAAFLAANATSTATGTVTIANCRLSGTVSAAYTNAFAAGIISQVTNATLEITDCYVSGSIIGDGSYVGGIVARVDDSAVNISGCTVAADIRGGSSYAGGIIGLVYTRATAGAKGTATITDCHVTMNGEQSISATEYAGGIVGSAGYTGTAKSITIDSCTVTGGSIIAIGATVALSPAGGIVGNIANVMTAKITNCYAETTIEVGKQAGGGLVGYFPTSTSSTGVLTIEKSGFNGTVNSGAATYVGGLVGYGGRLTISDCFIGGEIIGGSRVGGFIGYVPNVGANRETRIENSYSTANVYGTSTVGGVLGEQATNDAGIFTVKGVRVVGKTVTRYGLSTGVTFGALSGDARFHTANYVQKDTYAWPGLTLDRKFLSNMSAADALFSPERNGQAFISWSLRFADGWPSQMTEVGGAWSYIEGKLPVLTNFADKMSADFPSYFASVRDNGEVGDKSALQAAIDAASALKIDDFSAEAAKWSELQKTLTFAQQIIALYDASQEVIDAMTATVTTVRAELEELTAIKLEGKGTADEPFLISGLAQLLKMNRLVNAADAKIAGIYNAASYKLTADIDMSGVTTWTPLVYKGGTFDGDNHIISNLRLSSTAANLGFFGAVTGATIKNLTLDDFNIKGVSNIGAIAAAASANTKIENCHVRGTIIASGDYVGGIASSLTGSNAAAHSQILDCTAAVDILVTAGNGSYVGGIVGSMSNMATVSNCAVSNYTVGGAIVDNGSNGYVGGIVGQMSGNTATYCTVTQCSVNANISGLSVGGVVGYGNSNGSTLDSPGRIVISESYFNGVLTPASASKASVAGGIMGTLYNNVKITDCRSDGIINMATAAGGIVGKFIGNTSTPSYSTIANCYTTTSIVNGGKAAGILGDFSTSLATSTSKLYITDSVALNEQVSGETVAHAVSTVEEGHSRFVLTGVKAWGGMPVYLGGEAQGVPDAFALSYAELQLAASWPSGFRRAAAPWTLTDGELPVFAGEPPVNGALPVYLAGNSQPRVILNHKALLALINAADAETETKYTADSWAQLTAKLDGAKAQMRSTAATQDDVAEAIAALQAAIDALEPYKEPTTLIGTGDALTPYEIGSVADYDEMARLLDISTTDIYRTAYFKLTADIDLGGVTRSPLVYTTETSTSKAPMFEGDFDGGGHTISNLTIEHGWSAGMFGYVYGASIHDLTLESCSVSAAGSHSGAIAGTALGSVIENIFVVDGYVTGSSYLGGIIGSGGSTLTNCHFEGNVETLTNKLAYWVGGLVGNYSGNITDCSFKGKLIYNGTPQSQVMMGGIVGQFGGGDIRSCIVEADIIYRLKTGDSIVNTGADTGGIVGRFDGGTIDDSHFIGTIEGRGENTGGIVGNFKGSEITNSTSSGKILMNFPNDTGWSRPAGGIVGNIDTSAKGSVLIDNCESEMSINGFHEAGGIAGVATGSGTLTISNSKAMNEEINGRSNDKLDPFFFGEDWYDKFTGTFVSDNNYIWDGMKINGKTVEEWLHDTVNDGKYGGETGGVAIGPKPDLPKPDDGYHGGGDHDDGEPDDGGEPPTVPPSGGGGDAPTRPSTQTTEDEPKTEEPLTPVEEDYPNVPSVAPVVIVDAPAPAADAPNAAAAPQQPSEEPTQPNADAPKEPTNTVSRPDTTYVAPNANAPVLNITAADEDDATVITDDEKDEVIDAPVERETESEERLIESAPEREKIENNLPVAVITVIGGLLVVGGGVIAITAGRRRRSGGK
ncbi:MAG: FIVAR domain-containing protein [Oscillospiraceae bacterium]|jgi:hypothetical protein|nr:FIVAR domain-containing protein [Oscillospiraceae bacterium]